MTFLGQGAMLEEVVKLPLPLMWQGPKSTINNLDSCGCTV